MAYKKEKTILIASWIVTVLMLILFVPKQRMREAQVSFLFKQAITWLFGLLVVEKGLIEYPYRLVFKKANKASFTFEYFVYPATCVFFNLYYPSTSHALIKTLYYMGYCSLITIIEVLCEKYTDILHYKKWTWYGSFLTMWLTFYVSNVYFRWFFNVKS